jgi:putative flippase GtrA
VKRKLGYKESFADYLARFCVGAIVGAFIAFGLLTHFWIETIRVAMWFAIGCGILAAIVWNPFWEFIRDIAQIFTWRRF